MNRLKADSGSGMTLIEVLVAMSILSIVTLGMAKFYTTFVEASANTNALYSINHNLSLATHEIVNHLKTTAQNQQLRGLRPYEFVGRDGDDQGFLHSDTSPHNAYTIQPNNRSDRVHFHGFSPYVNLNNDTTSDRIYVAIWLNGEDSKNTVSGLDNSWGVVMRRKFHSNQELVPYYPPGSTQLSPLLDLNQAGTDHTSAYTSIIGDNIDYLSFQYFDPVGDVWKQTWDTVDPSNFPSDNRVPSAVKVAIRAYDERANQTTNSDRTVPPQWNQVTVPIKVNL